MVFQCPALLIFYVEWWPVLSGQKGIGRKCLFRDSSVQWKSLHNSFCKIFAIPLSRYFIQKLNWAYFLKSERRDWGMKVFTLTKSTCKFHALGRQNWESSNYRELILLCFYSSLFGMISPPFCIYFWLHVLNHLHLPCWETSDPETSIQPPLKAILYLESNL